MKKNFIAITLITFVLLSTLTYACSLTLNSTTSNEFFKEINHLDQQLKECPIILPKPIAFALGNNIYEFQITNNASTTRSFYIKINNKKVTRITNIRMQSSYYIKMTECSLNSILQSEDFLGAFAYAYKQKQIIIEGKGWWNKLKVISLRPILYIAFSKIAKPVELNC